MLITERCKHDDRFEKLLCEMWVFLVFWRAVGTFSWTGMFYSAKFKKNKTKTGWTVLRTHHIHQLDIFKWNAWSCCRFKIPECEALFFFKSPKGFIFFSWGQISWKLIFFFFFNLLEPLVALWTRTEKTEETWRRLSDIALNSPTDELQRGKSNSSFLAKAQFRLPRKSAARRVTVAFLKLNMTEGGGVCLDSSKGSKTNRTFAKNILVFTPLWKTSLWTRRWADDTNHWKSVAVTQEATVTLRSYLFLLFQKLKKEESNDPENRERNKQAWTFWRSG